ncbi:MAG: phage holin family protein [Oscillospiraceae bacterium]|nr:phage holin family protein [Oscillospiraceae bacterium]
MRDFWTMMKTTFAAVGAWLGYFLGGNDGLLYALLVFVVVDYITGVMCAIEDRKLSSAVGFRGLCRKVLTFLLVGIAQVLDVHVLNQPGVLRTAVIFWAIANNGLSILENAAHLGLPVPEQLKQVLEQLHDRAGKSGEPETVIGEEIEK